MADQHAPLHRVQLEQCFVASRQKRDDLQRSVRAYEQSLFLLICQICHEKLGSSFYIVLEEAGGVTVTWKSTTPPCAKPELVYDMQFQAEPTATAEVSTKSFLAMVRGNRDRHNFSGYFALGGQAFVGEEIGKWRAQQLTDEEILLKVQEEIDRNKPVPGTVGAAYPAYHYPQRCWQAALQKLTKDVGTGAKRRAQKPGAEVAAPKKAKLKGHAAQAVHAEPARTAEVAPHAALQAAAGSLSPEHLPTINGGAGVGQGAAAAGRGVVVPSQADAASSSPQQQPLATAGSMGGGQGTMAAEAASPERGVHMALHDGAGSSSSQQPLVIPVGPLVPPAFNASAEALLAAAQIIEECSAQAQAPKEAGAASTPEGATTRLHGHPTTQTSARSARPLGASAGAVAAARQLIANVQARAGPLQDGSHVRDRAFAAFTGTTTAANEAQAELVGAAHDACEAGAGGGPGLSATAAATATTSLDLEGRGALNEDLPVGKDVGTSEDAGAGPGPSSMATALVAMPVDIGGDLNEDQPDFAGGGPGTSSAAAATATTSLDMEGRGEMNMATKNGREAGTTAKRKQPLRQAVQQKQNLQASAPQVVAHTPLPWSRTRLGAARMPLGAARTPMGAARTPQAAAKAPMATAPDASSLAATKKLHPWPAHTVDVPLEEPRPVQGELPDYMVAAEGLDDLDDANIDRIMKALRKRGLVVVRGIKVGIKDHHSVGVATAQDIVDNGTIVFNNVTVDRNGDAVQVPERDINNKVVRRKGGKVDKVVLFDRNDDSNQQRLQRVYIDPDSEDPAVPSTIEEAIQLSSDNENALVVLEAMGKVHRWVSDNLLSPLQELYNAQETNLTGNNDHRDLAIGKTTGIANVPADPGNTNMPAHPVRAQDLHLDGTEGMNGFFCFYVLSMLYHLDAAPDSFYYMLSAMSAYNSGAVDSASEYAQKFMPFDVPVTTMELTAGDMVIMHMNTVHGGAAGLPGVSLSAYAPRWHWFVTPAKSHNGADTTLLSIFDKEFAAKFPRK